MRYERLRDMENVLKQKKMTQKELAIKYNVHRVTIYRDIRDLSCITNVVEVNHKYYIGEIKDNETS